MRFSGKGDAPMENVELAVRIDPDNPNHHLWNNNGTWWIHYTVYPNAWSAERVRRSLGTRSLEEARELRDRLFAEGGAR
jgi:hypothetical protein